MIKKDIAVRAKRALAFHGNQAYRQAFQFNKHYKTQLNAFAASQDHADLAVVIHLFYPESWPLFSQKLKLLGQTPFDLFVTLPASQWQFADIVKKEYPRAFCVEAPNRGRDVLPFLQVSKFLYDHDYQYVLKLHSKKSTHRTDGRQWLHEIVDNLMPNAEQVKAIVSCLQDKKTAIIGPSNQYISLKVNFEANGWHMTRVVNKLYGKKVSYDVLQRHRGDYGFFGGTMFWARLDAFETLLKKNYSAFYFEPEAGQIDGTFAHALERLFCVIPEIEQKKLYEVNASGLKAVDYSAGFIPEWSDLYTNPQA